MTKTRPPFSLVGIDHIVFIVDDLQKAVQWYADELGCQPGYSYPALGMEQVWCGAALIVLWDITHPGAAAAVPPVEEDRMREHLAAHGVTIERYAFHGGARGMGNSFYVLDPWGNKLELKGPAVYPDGRAQAG
jgi:glyoxylase I family protein